VEQASGLEGSDLAVALDEPATRLAVAAAERMVERRLAGEPLQYVLGGWGFRSLDLFVDPRVLIPRPETEVVVGRALAELDRIVGDSPETDDPVQVVDLGTGSGAIALSIASERTRAQVWATDASADALAVARSNLAGVGRAARRVRLSEGSWFDALPHSLRGAVHLVVSNPPYVAADEVLPAEVADWEPRDALVAGQNGTEALEAIVEGAADWLRPGGAVVAELAPHQAEVVEHLAVRAGLVGVRTFPDLAGRARVLRARRPPG
jgi:release factor glutamine methyltransferase